jgi:CSLREA domain-containing protein
MRRLPALLLSAFALLAAPAHAATFQVTTTADSAGAHCPGNCTLRGAIAAAAANGNDQNDLIFIPAGVYLLDMLQGSLKVPDGATRIAISGAGADRTTIQPAGRFTGQTLLHVGKGSQLGMFDLTLNGTYEPPSGAGGFARRPRR